MSYEACPLSASSLTSVVEGLETRKADRGIVSPLPRQEVVAPRSKIASLPLALLLATLPRGRLLLPRRCRRPVARGRCFLRRGRSLVRTAPRALWLLADDA